MVGLGEKNHLPLKSALPFVQLNFARRYLMNAILGEAWAAAVPQGDEMVMG
jgi:hypothetical protein